MQYETGAPARAPERPRDHLTLRTVANFLAVPTADLRGCLRSFEDWLHRCHAFPAPPSGKGWMPPASSSPSSLACPRRAVGAPTAAGPYAPTTAIADLGLRPSAMHKLREQNLYALEDFTQASEDELLATPDVGRSTVAQIRSHLHTIGLDFAPSAHPGRRAVERAKVAMRLPAHERHVTDASPILRPRPEAGHGEPLPGKADHNGGNCGRCPCETFGCALGRSRGRRSWPCWRPWGWSWPPSRRSLKSRATRRCLQGNDGRRARSVAVAARAAQ